MEKNVGNIDFGIRIILLVVFIYLSVKVSSWFIILVIGDGFTIATRSCYLYKLLGITTLKKKRK